jgi:hypothetical protein
VSVLLDEWTVRTAVHDRFSSWVANEALRTFEDTLLRGRGLPPIRFLPDDAYGAMLAEVARGRSTRIKQNLFRLLAHFRRIDPLTGPVPELPDAPRDLSATWLQALGEAIDGAADAWRAPQIVYPSARTAVWPATDEIAGTSAGAAFRRPLIRLEAYDEHPHACADWDPWDQRHRHRPRPGLDQDKPRLLPKPPELRDVPLRDMARALEVARQTPRRRGEGVTQRWYYVPADDWDPATLDCDAWRHDAFRRGNLNGRGGYLDVDGCVWHWDGNERHWDVQLDDRGAYRRVSHDGSLLD